VVNFKEKILSPVLRGLNWFYNSSWFVAFYAGIVLLSWTVECEYIAVITSIVVLCYMFLTQKHLDGLAIIATIIPAMVDNNMRYRIKFSQIFILVFLLLLVVLSAIYYIKKGYHKNDRKITKGYFFWVYVLCVFTLCFSGIGYTGNTFFKVLIPVGVHAALLGIYVLLYKCGSKDLRNTIIKSIIALACVIVAEVVIYLYRSGNVLAVLNTKDMSLGWAITNSVAVMLAFAVPLCFYLAKDKKVQLPYMILGSLLYASIFLTNCRSMIIFGTLVYVLTIILSFIYLDRWQSAIHLALFMIGAIYAVNALYDQIFSYFLRAGLDDSGRFELYEYYWGKFKENWLFGMGFYTDTEFQADGMVRAHNTIIQIFASMGIFGAVASIPYFYKRYRSFTIKLTPFKIFAFVAYLAMVGYGLLDCTIISSYKLIVIAMLMTAVEFDTIHAEEKDLLFKKRLKV